MLFNKEKYKKRLIDKTIEKYFSVFKCLLIEGPKWCGKTWTSKNITNKTLLLTNNDDYELIKINPKQIFQYDLNQYPLLIDEWQEIPELWNMIRNKIDESIDNQKFILTGSTSINNVNKNYSGPKLHSGTGRIARIKMHPMSLYESNDSEGLISIEDMKNKKEIFSKLKNKPTLEKLTNLIIRGGWPETLNYDSIEKFMLLSSSYLDTLVNQDIKQFGKRNSKTLMMIIKSLARNESTVVSNNTIINDCFENEEFDNNLSRITLNSYLDILKSLHILVEDNAFEINIRSSQKVGKSPKRHLVDPSLSCAALKISPKKLMSDIKTFGFMFEALVERDLRIYAQSLEGNLMHFRDNASGLEIDAIIEFSDGEYAIFEIKLGFNIIDEAKKNILKFRKNVSKKPIFSCIIVGLLDYTTYDVENDIYIIPITALKPC